MHVEVKAVGPLPVFGAGKRKGPQPGEGGQPGNCPQIFQKHLIVKYNSKLQ